MSKNKVVDEKKSREMNPSGFRIQSKGKNVMRNFMFSS